MDDARDAIFAWAVEGRLPQSKVAEALRLGEVTPDGGAWRRFIDWLLLALYASDTTLGNYQLGVSAVCELRN